VVTADGIAYMSGLEEGGVIPVLKHFPGLGGASGNTDNGTATTLPWMTLQTVGLPPFTAAIQDGAPAIMVSNAVVPGLTQLPASLSTVAITDELVGTLHFDGLILTDSLSAGAISDAGFSVTSAAVQAIVTGADMVMYTSASDAAALQQFQAIVDADVAAVGNGSLALGRLVAAAAAALTARHLNVCP
jgi:beta-N-acetylhexosaminidase